MPNIPFRDNLFINVRKIIFPAKIILGLVPKKARILDVGCGHGYLDHRLAIDGKQRQILAIDPSIKKIQRAKAIYGKIANLSFKKAYIGDVKNKHDIIIISDVLYLLPPKEKLKMLEQASRLISKNGFLILKETAQNPILKFEEFLATRLFKFTFTNNSETYLTGNPAYKKLLKKSGFRILEKKEIKRFFIYKHLIYKAMVN